MSAALPAADSGHSQSENTPAELLASEERLETLRELIDRWRLTPRDAARILWLPVFDVQRVLHDDAVPLQRESEVRLHLLDEIDELLGRHLGGALVPFWLRIPSSELGAPPIRHLERPTRDLRQVRWRLWRELGDRETKH